jgi:hypothetical protein
MKQSTNIRQNILSVSKKAAVMLALLLTLCTSYSFAKPTNGGTSEITASFRKDFGNAQIMNTEVQHLFTKITFKTSDRVMFAFYSDNGELLAVTRNIVSSELPVGLMVNLKAHYNNYWITELFEFDGDNQTCYYVTLQNADGRVILRSNGNNWEVYNTLKK